VNAGVEDFKRARADLLVILKSDLPGKNPTIQKVKTVIAKLTKGIDVNSKRENHVYGKMFNRPATQKSVNDFV